MSDNQMLYCLVAFILGWLVSRHMGNGFSVGAGALGASGRPGDLYTYTGEQLKNDMFFDNNLKKN